MYNYQKYKIKKTVLSNGIITNQNLNEKIIYISRNNKNLIIIEKIQLKNNININKIIAFFLKYVTIYMYEKGEFMETEIKNTESKMKSTITNLEQRFTNVRAGRANPNMLDKVMVEYYGVPTPIKSLANISVPEARQLMIKPFDRGILGGIEKAIFEANIGVTPNNNGECIFIVIPPLTEDRRHEFVKQVRQMAEEAKIGLRNIRQEANTHIKNLKLPEDEEKKGNEKVQDLINEYNKIVEEKLKEKEQELMTI